MHLRLLPIAAVLFAAAIPFACRAQSQADVIVPAEQVRYDYAQVLRVQPVEQVVTVASSERRCLDNGQCRQVRVPRDLRRTIGYDIEYSYQGRTYRSRVAQDPGRRMRIRVGVTPMVGSQVKP